MYVPIIGLVGLQGCGKGTAAAYLERRYGSRTFRFSAILKDVLERLAIRPSRDHYSALSEALRHAFGEDVLAYAIERDALTCNAPLVVIDGIRRVEDVAALEPLPRFHLVELTASDQTRFARLQARSEKPGESGMTWETFLANEALPTERTITDAAARAETRIDNEAGLSALETGLDELCVRLGVRPLN